MELYSYTVVRDYGVAPNPFWGQCTLAICTPNHMGAKVVPNDWIVGNSTVNTGSKLIYAMTVSEVLDFNDYFNDKRFESKKPTMNGSWKKQCGDNMYFLSGGQWQQVKNHFHDTDSFRKRDTKYPRVFIGRKFFYFGENAIDFPQRFLPLIKKGKGISKSHPTGLAENFVEWLQSQYDFGVHGNPRDLNKWRKGAASNSCVSPTKRTVPSGLTDLDEDSLWEMDRHYSSEINEARKTHANDDTGEAQRQALLSIEELLRKLELHETQYQLRRVFWQD